MASDYHVQQVWLGMLDSERLVRYYGYLAARLQSRHLLMTAFVALGSTGAAFTFLTGFSTTAASGLSILVAAAAIWSSYYDYSRKSVTASVMRKDCNELARQWGQLWSELQGLSDDEAAERTRALERMADDITAMAPTQLPTDDSLNEKCATEVYELNRAQQAA